jgi:hypothetical protein
MQDYKHHSDNSLLVLKLVFLNESGRLRPFPGSKTIAFPVFYLGFSLADLRHPFPQDPLRVRHWGRLLNSPGQSDRLITSLDLAGLHKRGSRTCSFTPDGFSSVSSLWHRFARSSGRVRECNHRCAELLIQGKKEPVLTRR